MEGVRRELLDGDDEAVGETRLVDEAETAVADDQIRREVLGGLGDLLHGDLDVGVEGPAGIDGDGGQLRLGRITGLGTDLALTWRDLVSFAGEDHGGEEEGDDEEAGGGGGDSLEGGIHGGGERGGD